MLGTHGRHDHGPSRLTRQLGGLTALAAAVVVALSWAPAAAAQREIHLPTRADAAAFSPRTECLLNGANTPLPSIIVRGCLETRLPGPVRDREAVRVGIGPTGRPLAVRVTQRLRLSGLGDFSFKVPGPAVTVDGLPGSEEQPGLRKGAVLWQGFSPGERTLGAALTLHPDLEAARLPLRVRIRASVEGRPISGNEPVSGAFEMTIRIENTSAVPVTLNGGATDPAAVGAALDLVRRELLHGRRPVPGEDGLPASLPARSPERNAGEEIEAPFAVSGVLSFPAETMREVRSEGATPIAGGASPSFRIHAQLGGGRPRAFTIRVRGQASRLRLPHLTLRAMPSPPLASSVTPPSGASWAAYAAAHPSRTPEMVATLLRALWQTARLSQYDAYLGNPDPNGVSSTNYVFTVVATPEREGPRLRTAGPGELDPLGVLVFALIALAALGALAVVWSRA